MTSLVRTARIDASALARCVWLVAVLAGLVVVSAGSFAAQSGVRVGAGSAARRAAGAGLPALPLSAIGPVSAGLGRDDAAYRVRGLRGANAAAGVRLRFDRSGAEISTGSATVALGVVGVRSGVTFSPVDPQVSGNRVVYTERGLSQWFANGPLGLEQGFGVARRPAGRGPLTLTVSLSGVIRMRIEGSDRALLTLPGGRALRYGDVSALDARGRPLAARLAARAGRLTVIVDDRDARFPVTIDPLVQQALLLGSGAIGAARQGYSVAMSGDGDTLIVGGPTDAAGKKADMGAAWVFARSGSSWTQQAILVGDCDPGCTNGTGENADGEFGASVALSSNGSTAVVGAPVAAQAWVFTRTGTTWTQQALLSPPSVPGCGVETGSFGAGVSVSSSGDTALIGMPGYTGDCEGDQGAALVYSRSSSAWGAPQTLTSGGSNQFGQTVALSPDGATALIGSPAQSGGVGAAWVFTDGGGGWTQQGPTLEGDCTGDCTGEGTGEHGVGAFGWAVALANHGTTALIGGDGAAGNAWVFAGTPGSWTQQALLEGNCTVPICAGQGTGEDGAGEFGSSVALSSSGATALIGGDDDSGGAGGAWEFTRSGGSWSQLGAELVGDCSTGCAGEGSGETGAGRFGASVALSSSGDSLLIGAPDNGNSPADGGAAWVFAPPAVHQNTTSAALTAPSGPVTVAANVTFTATVSPSPDGGTVSFSAGGVTLSGCGAVPVVAGEAGCTTTFSAVSIGPLPIAVTYSGDTNFASSAASGSVTVDPAPTAIAVSPTDSTPLAGEPVTFIATVTPAPDGGTVSFTNATVPIPGCGSLPVQPGGVATCTLTFPTGGYHFIYASYSGDTDYLSSLSAFAALLPAAYQNTSVGISVAQAAGDPAQTGPNGSTLSYDGVPLVAGRATLVRVFVDPVGLEVPGTSGLTATLMGSANGKPLPGSPLTPDQGGPAALGDDSISDQLGQADTAFNFVLPSSWTTGTVQLTADVTQPSPFPAGDETCVSPCNTSLTLGSVGFTTMPPFEVTAVQLTWTDDQSNQLEAPGDPQAAMALAYELMPVHTVVNAGYQGTIDETSLQNDPGGAGGDQADLDGLNLVDNWAKQQFDADCCNSTGDLHDMVVGINVGLARGDTYINNELGAITQGKTLISTVYEPVAVVDGPQNVLVAHEMGHAVGRLHADHGCGGPAGGGSDPDWPDYDGHLEPTANLANGVAPSSQTSAAAQSYGVNLAWRVPQSDGNGPFVIFPDSAYDLMSYCGNEWETNPTAADPGIEWISPRGWQQEFTCLQERPVSGCPVNEQQASQGEVQASVRRPARARAASPRSGGLASVPSAIPAASSSGPGPVIDGPALSFIGYVAPGGTLMAPSLMPVTGGAAGAAKSPFTVTVTGRAGRVVATEPLSYQPMHLDATPGHPALALLALQGDVPTHGQTIAGVAVRDDGQVIERIPAPRIVPRVTVISAQVARKTQLITVRWNSHDKSGPRRTAFVYFSTGGRRFRTVWEGFDRGSATLSLALLGGARRVRLRVSINDGFTLTSATTRPIRLPVLKRAAISGPTPAWMRALQRDGIDLVSP